MSEEKTVTKDKKDTKTETPLNKSNVEGRVMKPCPFCKAVPVPKNKNEYKVYHKTKCFLAAVYEKGGWLLGERQIKLWNRRAL